MKRASKASRNGSPDDAVAVLRRFFAEMNAWEWQMIRQDFSDLADAPAEVAEAEVEKRDQALLDRLADIFDRYCEAGRNARRVRDVLHCGGHEPDYNPDTEQILSVVDKGDKVVVETQMAHNFKFRFRYELVRVDGRWRIRDNRKHKADFRPTWSRWDL